MQLTRTESSPVITISGADDRIELTDGKLLIKCSDTELLNEKVPKGKKWLVSVSVVIQEITI